MCVCAEAKRRPRTVMLTSPPTKSLNTLMTSCFDLVFLKSVRHVPSHFYREDGGITQRNYFSFMHLRCEQAFIFSQYAFYRVFCKATSVAPGFKKLFCSHYHHYKTIWGLCINVLKFKINTTIHLTICWVHRSHFIALFWSPPTPLGYVCRFHCVVNQ